MFNNNGSIISLKWPEINKVKKTIAGIISLIYTNSRCPENIFKSLYLTLLVESQYLNRDSNNETILMNVTEVLSLHAQRGLFNQLFRDNLPQTIIALFMLSITSKEEKKALNNNPE